MMQKINIKDIEKQLEFFSHKLFWCHIFKPQINGNKQPGDLHSEFCSKERVIELCKKYNGRGLCCVAINERPEGVTKTDDLKEVGALFIDIDVRKELKKGFVSIPEHHEHAINTTLNDIKPYLESIGFVVGLVVDSGNGCHIFIKLEEKIDVSTKEKRELFKEKAAALEENLRTRFADEILQIDFCTKDPNRRVKLAGTMNMKDTEQIENRLSRNY